LDVQLYEALKKGLYKPAAWFKGILFPLCEVSLADDRPRYGADEKMIEWMFVERGDRRCVRPFKSFRSRFTFRCSVDATCRNGLQR
jgi:hypothetical protein